MDSRPWRILLVEDDEDDYILTRALLKESRGDRFELLWAPSYDSGLQQLDTPYLDVILVDYLLDNHNGLELVREAVSQGCKAPIIVFTGQDSYEVDIEAMRVGAVDYLVKGQINAVLLERTIRYAIEHKQSEEALKRAHDELELRVQERTQELAKVNEDLRAEIYERRRAEEALSASEAKFRKLAETTSTAIFIVQDNRIRYANTAAGFITGYSPEELGEMEFRQLAHPGFQDKLQRYSRSSEKHSDQQAPTLVPFRDELKLVTKNGQERWVDATGGTIEYESSTAWVITIFDITERDLAEQALRKAKEELEIRVAERTGELRDTNERLQIELIERERVEQEREQYLDRLNTLIQVSQVILAEKTLESLLEQIVGASLKLTGASMGLAGTGYDSGTFEIEAASCPEGSLEWLAHEIFEPYEASPYFDLLKDQPTVQLTASQISATPALSSLVSGSSHIPQGLIGARLAGRNDQNNGLLLVFNKIDEDFSPEDEALLSQLAALASLGIQHISARTEAESRADELDAVFAAMIDVVIVYDEVGFPVKANPAALENYGIDPVGKTPEEFFSLLFIRYPDGKPLSLEDMPSRRALRGETVTDQRLIYRNARGNDVTFLVSASPLYEGERVSGAVSVWHDVTEIEQLLAQLESGRARLGAIIANAPVAISVADDQGRTVSMNPLAEKLFGDWPLNRKSSAGPTYILKHQDGTPIQTWDHPLTRSVQYGESQINLELTYTPEDGPERYLLVNSVPILDRKNKIQGAVGIFQDITQRKAAEEVLRHARDELELRVRERTQELAVANEELKAEILERKRAEELLRQNATRSEVLAEISRLLVQTGYDYQALLDIVSRSIAGMVGDACIIRMVSEDGEHLQPVAYYHPNPEAMALLGESLALLPVEESDRFHRQVLQSDQPLLIPELPLDFQENPEDGLALPFFEHNRIHSLLIVPIPVQGEAHGTISLFRQQPDCPYTQEDLVLLKSLASRTALAITNVRLYQDLEDALQKEQAMRRQLVLAEKHSALSRMVASVAHELNNPIQTIQNCLFLTYQDIPSDSPIHEYLNMALSETRRVSNLVTQLREIYRPSKTTPVDYVDLIKLLEQVKTLLQPHLQHQHVVWKSEYSENEVLIAASADQIKQVFLNISLNAIEAMQPDGGNLAVKLDYSPGYDRIGVVFSDSGPGISKENMTKLFEPFFTTKDSGTGLGLSICYDIVHRHRGEITIDSQEGQGAAFTIWLPLIKEDVEVKEALAAG